MATGLVRCFYVYPLLNTFVQRDREVLESLGVEVKATPVTPTHNPILYLTRLFFLFFQSIWSVSRSHRVICWFSDYHAFLPLLVAKFFTRRSLLIVGGFDAVSDPVNAYGIFYKKGIRQYLARWNYRLADCIWVVDESLQKGCPHSYKRSRISSGIENWVPEVKPKIEVVPTGYDPEYWKRTRNKTPKTVLTVANLTSEQVIHRKGIPMFIEMARACPEWVFTIVGDLDNRIANAFTIPSNLQVYGKKNPEELVAIYSRHSYYFQGSRVEGLPNVLCEAMLCECIPIGQRAFGIERAIGQTGVVFDEKPAPKAYKKMLEEAATKQGSACREQIIKAFHQSHRIEKLKQYLFD